MKETSEKVGNGNEDSKRFGFDSVKNTIKAYSDGGIKSLQKCTETIATLVEEKKAYEEQGAVSNPYLALADNFKKYNEGFLEDRDDCYFYKYLESLENTTEYVFYFKDDEVVKCPINLLNPFITVIKKDGSGLDLVNPAWHLIVAHYAYLDAAFNHDDSKYAQWITIKNGWEREHKKLNFNCKSLRTWKAESGLN